MFKKPPELSYSSAVQSWLLQALFIILAVFLSILTVTWILEKSLVKNALELEADAFINAFSQDPHFPLPHTRNLMGYLQYEDRNQHIPHSLLDLDLGLHSQVEMIGRQEPVPVYVREFDNYRLYLVFEGANIDRLVGIFGLVPLATLLIIIYLSSWIAYRLSWRAVSPILSITQKIRNTQPESAKLDLPVLRLTGETRELAIALQEYEARINAFVDRERQFTADVSHELRTPMTIIDGAAQFLLSEHAISSKGAQRVQMIRRACEDVDELLRAFLLMAREQTVTSADEVLMRAVVENEVHKLQSISTFQNIHFEIEGSATLSVPTPRKVLEIIIGNICRNACLYTQQGEVRIDISETGLSICDTGPGIDEDLLTHIFDRHTRGRGHSQAGEGIGLAIVKRLCDQFNWTIDIKNQSKGGVEVSLEYAP